MTEKHIFKKLDFIQIKNSCSSKDAFRKLKKIRTKYPQYAHLYSSAIKNNKIMSFAATWMNLEIIIVGKVGQKKKDKYDTAYMWNLEKNGTNELLFIKQKQSRRY